MTKSVNSRNIPLPIQREVRQRCGFGCVICGLPLYEYEHMEGWATVKRHVASEITLLCDMHHREKTSGIMPLQVVIDANNDPHNLKHGVSKPYTLHYSGDGAEVEIGTNKFVNNDKGYGARLMPIIIDGIPIVGIILADGHFLLNIVLFDEYNNLVLQIKNNQLIYTVDTWDIQLVGRRLTIRQGHRDIFIIIQFDTPNKVTITQGRFLTNGVEVVISDKGVFINGIIEVGDCQFEHTAGIVIGKNQNVNGCLHFENVFRYAHLRDETS